MSDIPNCRPFRTVIPVKVFNNFSGVGNLRKVLQEGFRSDWDGVCGSRMERDGGRCGHLDEKRRTGLITEPVAAGGGPKQQRPKQRVMLIIGFWLVLETVIACAIYIYYLQRRRMKRRSQQRGQDELLLRHYPNNDNSTPASIEAFLHNYYSGMPTIEILLDSPTNS
ncbi:uncharacterized protein LOC131244051 [Magnolia sinica]|uniref:uncharacterized protein LOC131244051 n=1 Tax=Magnolia sinica TaxID=86752 RepID=UPI00265AA57A|nr:uncharacterized protein LOC131244051 [Magnolia sinica]